MITFLSLFINIPTTSVILLVFVATESIVKVSGDTIGVNICACSPKTYEFTFDFSLTCPPVDIAVGDGVVATSCLISPFGSPEVTDLTPIVVESIDILELNQNLALVAQDNVVRNFNDGDTFQYTPAIATIG